MLTMLINKEPECTFQHGQLNNLERSTDKIAIAYIRAKCPNVVTLRDWGATVRTSSYTMKYLILISALAYVAYSQVPGPCESPKQWEGRVFTTDRSKNFTQIGKVSYDETQRRERVIEEVEFGSDRDYFDSLFLHNVGKAYILNLKTRKCNVTNLTEPFIPRGVPREAEFAGSATIGAAGVPGEFMVVENFRGTFRSSGSKFFGVSTVPDCFPIEFGYYSEKTGFVQQTIFDANIGISDPNVFIPPKECL